MNRGSLQGTGGISVQKDASKREVISHLVLQFVGFVRINAR